MYLGKPPGSSLPIVSAHSFASNTDNLLFLNQRKREIFHENVPRAMDNLGTAAYEADTLPTKLPRPVWIKEVEGLHYLCSETKGADQLRFWFRICKKQVFFMMQLRWCYVIGFFQTKFVCVTVVICDQVHEVVTLLTANRISKSYFLGISHI